MEVRSGNFSYARGNNRQVRYWPENVRRAQLIAKRWEIDAWAKDRSIDPEIVHEVAASALRLGRVPDLSGLGLSYDDSEAVAHFVVDAFLNMEDEDCEGDEMLEGRGRFRTEHSGAKKGRGAFYGRKADAKRESNKGRRFNDRRAEQENTASADLRQLVKSRSLHQSLKALMLDAADDLDEVPYAAKSLIKAIRLAKKRGERGILKDLEAIRDDVKSKHEDCEGDWLDEGSPEGELKKEMKKKTLKFWQQGDPIKPLEGTVLATALAFNIKGQNREFDKRFGVLGRSFLIDVVIDKLQKKGLLKLNRILTKRGLQAWEQFKYEHGFEWGDIKTMVKKFKLKKITDSQLKRLHLKMGKQGTLPESIEDCDNLDEAYGRRRGGSKKAKRQAFMRAFEAAATKANPKVRMGDWAEATHAFFQGEDPKKAGTVYGKRELKSPTKRQKFDGTWEDVDCEGDYIDEARKLSPKQALSQLKKTRSLSTDLLKPLGIGMETFLKYAQRRLTKAQDDKIIDGLIAGFEKKFGESIVEAWMERTGLCEGDTRKGSYTSATTKKSYPFSRMTKKYRKATDDSLRFVRQDAYEAMKAADRMGDEIASGWYQDDVHTVNKEMKRRGLKLGRLKESVYDLELREYQPSPIGQEYMDQFKEMLDHANHRPDRILDRSVLPEGKSKLNIKSPRGVRLNIEMERLHGDPISYKSPEGVRLSEDVDLTIKQQKMWNDLGERGWSWDKFSRTYL